ncbi:MAG TPA: twin-arginine translocation signal domain-containing protein [Kofleriaceae bacterium]
MKPRGVPWTTPTRRAFLAMLGAGAAVVAVGVPADSGEPKPVVVPSRPIWIGHC